MTDDTGVARALTCAIAETACRPDDLIIVRTRAGVMARTPAAPPYGTSGCVDVWIDGTGVVVTVPSRDRLRPLAWWPVPFVMMHDPEARDRFTERLRNALDLAAPMLRKPAVATWAP